MDSSWSCTPLADGTLSPVRQHGSQQLYARTILRALLGLIYAHGALCDKYVNARSAHFFRAPEIHHKYEAHAVHHGEMLDQRCALDMFVRHKFKAQGKPVKTCFPGGQTHLGSQGAQSCQARMRGSARWTLCGDSMALRSMNFVAAVICRLSHFEECDNFATNSQQRLSSPDCAGEDPISRSWKERGEWYALGESNPSCKNENLES